MNFIHSKTRPKLYRTVRRKQLARTPTPDKIHDVARIEIRRASELGESAQISISEIFVDGFGQHFVYFSKDRQKLVRAFAHSFVLAVFYVALVDGEVAGITALTDGKASPLHFRWREFIRHLGLVRGTIATFILRRYFQDPAAETGTGIGSVEFVATAPKFRGKGVASAIMHHLFALPQYEQYVLEVADINTSARNLYHKLGYREFRRVKTDHGQRTGINELIYMKYRKPQS